MRKTFVCFFLFLFLFSCDKNTNKYIKESTEAETEVIELEKHEKKFANMFEANRVLVSLMELPYSISCYTNDSQEAYKIIVNKISQAIPTFDNIETIKSYIFELQKVLETMKIKTGDVPCVYIFTVDNPVNEIYSFVKILVVDEDGNEYTSGTEVQIKLRGNSTMGANKKPYTLKFDEKVSLLNMEKSRKWILLANAFDKTLLRNKMALDFAQNLNFDYSPECRFADVYLNDVYKGLYLLSEDVNEGKNRIDIDIEKDDYLFEHESDRIETGKIYISTKQGMRLKICEPENITSEQCSNIRTYLLEIEEAMNTDNYNMFSKYINIDSFIDYYLMMELFKDVDGWYSSVYFYLKDGILYAGPVWDFDLCCGNASKLFDEDKYRSYWNAPGYGTGSGNSADAIWMQFGWFKILMQNNQFQSKVQARYKDLQPYIVNLYENNKIGRNQIDVLLDVYRDAIDRNNEIWDVTMATGIFEMKPYADYNKNVEYYRNWLVYRNDYLLDYFNG